MNKNSWLKKLEENRNIVLITCILCFAFSFCVQIWRMFPLSDVLMGHDHQYHYLRVEAVRSKIQNGGLFTGGIDYLFLGGAGYASSAAYPSLLLYIPALLRTAGLGVGYSMKIFLLAVSAVTYILMHYCVKNISGSQICGSLAAVMYTLSVYRADNLYVRFALGEFVAFLFWPLIIYGLYDLAYKGLKKPWILGAGFCGMLLTHTISTVIASVFAFVYFLCSLRKILKIRGTFFRLCLTAAGSMLVTAYYWMPFLEMLTAEDMAVSHPTFRASNFTVSLFTMLGDSDIEGLGIVMFLAVIPRLFLTEKSPAYEMIRRDTDCGESRPAPLAFADALLITAFAAAFFATDYAPWQFIGKFLDGLQFAWRVYGLVTASLAVSGALYTYYILKYTDALKRGAVIITAVFALGYGVHSNGKNVNHCYPDNSYYDVPDNTYTIGMGEWLPDAFRREGDKAREKTKCITFDGNVVSDDFAREYGIVVFDVPDAGYSTAEVPFVWYKGYTAEDETGQRLDVRISECGLLDVDISNASGTVTVWHHTTAVQDVSLALSLISLAAFAAVSVKNNGKIKSFFRKKKES